MTDKIFSSTTLKRNGQSESFYGVTNCINCSPAFKAGAEQGYYEEKHD